MARRNQALERLDRRGRGGEKIGTGNERKKQSRR